MNVEIMGSCGEPRGAFYDLSGKELEPVISAWADRWVAHRLGDFIGLDAFLESPAATFLSLAARPDFALGRRGRKGKKNGQKSH